MMNFSWIHGDVHSPKLSPRNLCIIVSKSKAAKMFGFASSGDEFDAVQKTADWKSDHFRDSVLMT